MTGSAGAFGAGVSVVLVDLGDRASAPPLTLASFHNALRILTSLDSDEIGLTHWQWEQFRTDPLRFFVRADDATAERIWQAMVNRGATT